MPNSVPEGLRLVRVRLSPRTFAKTWEIQETSRLHVVNPDDNGFVLVEVKLAPGEQVGYRCGHILYDPAKAYSDCPVCGARDFNG